MDKDIFVCILLLTLMIMGLFSALPLVGATGWLAGWSYRKSHVINSATGAGANYQIKINVHPGSGTDSGADVYLNGHAKADLSDVRFAESDGSTLLSYWLQSTTPNATTSTANKVITGACWTPNGTLYAATSNPINIYKSQDGGQTWSNALITFFGTDANSLYVASNGYVYVSPAGIALNSTTAGIWRSTNGGNAWTRVSSAFNTSVQGNVWLDFAEDNEGRLFAGEYNNATAGGNCYIYRSQDNGATWSSVYYNGSERHVHDVAVDPSTDYVYATIGDDGTPSSSVHLLIRSTDHGSTWTRILPTIPKLVAIYCGNGYRLFGSDTEGGGYIYKTTDDSSYTTVLSNTDDMYGVTKIRKNPTTGNLYADFISCDGLAVSRIYISADGGTTWSSVLTAPNSGSPGWIGWQSISNFYQNTAFMYYQNSTGAHYIYQLGTKLVDTYSGTFWVKIPDNLGTSSDTIYVYYGKSSATTASDGYSTFTFFDDFPGSSVNGSNWVTRQGSISVNGGTLVVSSTTGTRGLIDGLTSFGLNTSLSVRAYWSATKVTDAHFCSMRIPNDANNVVDVYGYYVNNQAEFETILSGTATDTQHTPTTPTGYHIYSLARKSGQSQFYQDSTLMSTHTSNIPSSSMVAYFKQGDISGGGTVYVDWVFVRKWVSTEPSQGSWGSEQAFLSVTVSPSSASLDVGQSQLFTATVAGVASPYSCQWYLNGGKISGATSSTYTFTASSAGSPSLYVNVTDSLGDVAVSAVAITVSFDPSVSVSPSSASLDYNNPSQSQLFTAMVIGGLSPYSYQWYLNGVTISGATSSTYTFTPTLSQAGSNSLYVNVTDSNNYVVRSNTATITVSSAPNVTISPSSLTIDVGQSQTFTSSVSEGLAPYIYQWFFDGVQVGASNSYTFTPSGAASNTVYLNVTDSNNYRIKSNVVTITVHSTPIVSISPSGSITMNAGQQKTFNSTVSDGTSPYTYQWYLNGTSLSGATSGTWVFTTLSTGTYFVVLSITDHVGYTTNSTSTSVAVVTVNSALSVSISPSGSTTIDMGQSLTFTATVNGGTSPYSYQWYLNGAKVSGATLNTWIFMPSSPSTYSVYANVTDNTGAYAISSASTVIANWHLVVTISPVSATIYNGQSQTFTSSTENGTSPYAYQWYLNSTVQTGATSSLWIYTPSSTGTYKVYVIVTDSVGQAALSSNATLAVNNPLMTVVVTPSAVSLGLNQSQTFTSNVNGGIPSYAYQWYLDGSAISGATSSAYTFTPSSMGSYYLCLNVTDSFKLRAGFTVTVDVWGSAFSVVSNSTVSGLVFNSTSEVLSFTVTGPPGTYGYANVTIANTLIAKISTLEVYVDGNQITYTVTSANYYWLLHFTYHHSTHKIVIRMGALQPEAASEAQYGSFAIIGGIAIATTAVAVVIISAIFRKKAKKT